MIDVLKRYFDEIGEIPDADLYNARADKPFTIREIKKAFGSYHNVILAVKTSESDKKKTPKTSKKGSVNGQNAKVTD